MRPDRRVAALDCGHEAPTPALGLPPRVGSYLSCPDKCLGGPKRVTAVRAVPDRGGARIPPAKGQQVHPHPETTRTAPPVPVVYVQEALL